MSAALPENPRFTYCELELRSDFSTNTRLSLGMTPFLARAIFHPRSQSHSRLERLSEQPVRSSLWPPLGDTKRLRPQRGCANLPSRFAMSGDSQQRSSDFLGSKVYFKRHGNTPGRHRRAIQLSMALEFSFGTRGGGLKSRNWTKPEHLASDLS